MPPLSPMPPVSPMSPVPPPAAGSSPPAAGARPVMAPREALLVVPGAAVGLLGFIVALYVGSALAALGQWGALAGSALLVAVVLVFLRRCERGPTLVLSERRLVRLFLGATALALAAAP